MNKKEIYLFSMLFIFSIMLMAVPTMMTVSTDIKQSRNSPSFESYKFIVFGDTRTGGEDNTGLETVVDIIENIMEDNEIEFLLHVGDAVDKGGVQSYWDDYYWPVINNSGLKDKPIFYAVGNHEYSESDDLETFFANAGKNNPGNKEYFSLNTEQNDTHIIFLNSCYYFTDYNETKQQEQMDWLAADLAATDTDRIIVIDHHPLYSMNGSPDRIVETETLREKWLDYFIDQGIDMVFSGHDHFFYHTRRNNSIDLVVTGAGTSALVKPIPNAPDIEKNLLEDDFWFGGDYEVCLVEATATGFNVDVIVSNGSVVYSFVHEEEIKETTTTTTAASTSATTITNTTTGESSITGDETTPGLETGTVMATLIVLSWVFVSKRKNKK